MEAGVNGQLSASYLIDILRYTVHLVSPRHRGIFFSQNHRPDFFSDGSFPKKYYWRKAQSRWKES